MSCYYQGCSQRGHTKEHIPPGSFFPKDQRNQLLTVTSCELHNNANDERSRAMGIDYGGDFLVNFVPDPHQALFLARV
jgi:hypothetical protein